jgi:hypothetical protein
MDATRRGGGIGRSKLQRSGAGLGGLTTNLYMGGGLIAWTHGLTARLYSEGGLTARLCSGCCRTAWTRGLTNIGGKTDGT